MFAQRTGQAFAAISVRAVVALLRLKRWTVFGWMARWAMAGNMWGEMGMLTAGSQQLLFDHHFDYLPTVQTCLIGFLGFVFGQHAKE